MLNTLQDYINIIRKNNIQVESIIEIGSRDGTDADILKKEFNISDENVHIIEPNPILFDDIKRNFPNYKSYQVAISNINSISTFYQVNTEWEDFNGMSSLSYRKIYDYPELNVKKIEVETKTANQFISEINIGKFILKIDVEGFTYEVLVGFGDALNNVTAIHLESEEYQLWDNQKTTHDIYKVLSEKFICVFKKRVTIEAHDTQYDEIWINKNNFCYTIDNYFDKVFYLNLDKDVERNNKMVQQLKKYNITNYERISATQLDEIPNYQYWRNFNVELLSERYIKGQLGCRNSHWRAIEASFLRGYNRVLIFEDDVIINEDPNQVLENNKDLLNEWHMLYFGGVEEHHFGGQIVLAHAYALNRKIIEECYFMIPTSGMELDNFYAKVLFHMSYNYSPTGKYLVKKLQPFNTIIQDKSHKSNITG